MTRMDWRINIENLAAEVAAKCGNDVARSAFTACDATCFDDLSPANYWEVFGNLQQIAADVDDDDEDG